MGSKVSMYQQHGHTKIHGVHRKMYPQPRLKCDSKLIHKIKHDKYVHLRSAISKTKDKMRDMIFSSFIELFLCVL